MPWPVANALITVVSTLLCTELHALFTFGTGSRPGWRRHLQSAGSATAAYLVTCAAMFLLHAVQSSPGLLREHRPLPGPAPVRLRGRPERDVGTADRDTADRGTEAGDERLESSVCEGWGVCRMTADYGS
jgi:hypothetical protein